MSIGNQFLLNVNKPYLEEILIPFLPGSSSVVYMSVKTLMPYRHMVFDIENIDSASVVCRRSVVVNFFKDLLHQIVLHTRCGFFEGHVLSPIFRWT